MYVSRLSSAPTSGRRTLGSVVNQLVSAAELLNELLSRRRVDRKVLEVARKHHAKLFKQSLLRDVKLSRGRLSSSDSPL